MNWQTLLESRIVLWGLGFFFIILISLIFRKQLGSLIDRLTKGDVEAGRGGVKVHIEATKTKSLNRPQKYNDPVNKLARADNLDSIPAKHYRHLIGRQSEAENILALLRQQNEKKTIALTGLGGIGKTALAREIVDQCKTENLFEEIFWIGPKTEFFIGRVTRNAKAQNLTFDQLLNFIGRQLNRSDLLKMQLVDKQHAIKSLFEQKHFLLIIDNLDTIPDYENLVNQLFLLLGRSKALITSRFQTKNESVYTLQMSGLSADASLEFIKDEALARNVEVVFEAAKTRLLEIHRITGGAPLAMKLVVGQMGQHAIEDVLENLRKATFKGPDYEFYRFLYQYSWSLLENNARQALVDMSVFPPVTGGAIADVKAIGQLDEGEFWNATDKLVTMSLLDKIGAVGKERFALHPLTQYFIKSDITKEWSTE